MINKRLLLKAVIWNLLYAIIAYTIFMVISIISLLIKFGLGIYGSRTIFGFVVSLFIIIGIVIEVYYIIRFNKKYFKKNRTQLMISPLNYTLFIIIIYIIFTLVALRLIFS